METNRNLYIAIAISLVILIGFHFAYEVPRQERLRQIQAQEQALNGAGGSGDQITHTRNGEKADSPAAEVSTVNDGAPIVARADALAGTRAAIDNPQLHGTLALGGIRFDDLTFKNYYTAIDHKDQVNLLSPSGTEAPYYASFGWVGDKGVTLPGDDTQWKGDAADLTSVRPSGDFVLR